MAVLATQAPSLSGLAASYSAATATTGDTFKAERGAIVHVKNGGGSPTTVTFDALATPGGMTLTDPGGSVPAAGDRFFTLSDPRYFKDSNGMCKVTCSVVTSVTVAVIKA